MTRAPARPSEVAGRGRYVVALEREGTEIALWQDLAG